MILVAVFDKKAESFGPAYTSKNEPVAVRDFSQGCQDTQSNLNKFPEDYALYKIGEFNQETGEITPETIKIIEKEKEIKKIKPKLLVEAKVFIGEKNNG